MRSLFLAVFAVLAACRPDKPLMFTALPASRTGVAFENTLVETAALNVMNYEYLYNGGGVAAADFDNDGLCDLYFTGNAVPNRLYLNRGGLQFEDATWRAGVAGRARWKTGVTVADVNADGWLDLYVCYSGPVPKDSLSNQLFINNGTRGGGQGVTFTERAAEYGLDAPSTFSTQAAFLDYDRDGDLDMFLLNHGNRFYTPFFNTRKLRTKRHPQFGNRLYRNDGGRFAEVSDAAGIHGGGLNFGLGVAVSDLNADGWPDLYVTNDYEEQDYCYLNNADGTFRDVTKQAFGHLSRFGMGADIADYNNDARPDVLVMDMLPEDNHRQKLLKGPDEYKRYRLMADSGFHYQQMRNTLQLNRGNDAAGTPLFSEIGQLAGVAATDWSWAALLADLDNDGFKDLLVTNGYLRDFTNMDFLKYTVEEARQKAAAQGRPLPVGELISQMPSTLTSDYVFRNNGGDRPGDLTFTDKTREWGFFQPNLSFGAACADLDNDGDLDLVVNHTNQAASVWENHARRLGKGHFLRIRLKGPAGNTHGLGARVYLEQPGQVQFQELSLTRGYQSAVEPVLHFGLGRDTAVQRLRIVWPDGKQTEMHGVKADQVLAASHRDAVAVSTPPAAPPAPLFANATAGSGLDFLHRENDFVDFDTEPLIPYQPSRSGPPLAKADVDADGDEDFYAGGAAGQSGRLYLARPGGRFAPALGQPWAADSSCEDTGAAFLDADADGDPDLYVLSGGNEQPLGSAVLRDRLYLNDGRGGFSPAPPGSLPDEFANGSCVAAADYDRDGDTDLFVGGGVQPGAYPQPSPGGLLRNDTDPRTRKIKFAVVTREVNPALREPGLLTDALWTDYNGDGWPDLMLAGEWMPVRLFENRRGRLHEVAPAALAQSGGWWRRIAAADFDRDGDPDYVLGNAGTNLPWHASAAEPMGLHYADFNDDGRLDPIMTCYMQGRPYPVATRDELLNQLNGLRQKFVNYAQYADAGLADILTPRQREQARNLAIHTLESSYLENLGGGRFARRPLPVQAQFSMANALSAGDYNHDGHLDVVLAGNFHAFRVQYGPQDAGLGLLLAGDGKGRFRPVPLSESGLLAPGDVRTAVALPDKAGGLRLVLGRNNGSLRVLQSERPGTGKR